MRTNIKLLKRNPKKYHKCIQNIIGWNVELGQSVSIDNYSDLDCSQVYEDDKQKIHYGREAKEVVQ